MWLSHSHESEQEGYWYYFNNRDEPKPEAAFYLPGYRVEVSVDPATGVMTTCLHAKNKGWLSVSGPTKVFPPLPLCHAICHLLPPPLAAPAPSFLHPLQLPSAHELRITHVDAWFGWAGGKQVAVRVDATGLSVSNGLVLSEWKTALLSFAAPEAR